MGQLLIIFFAVLLLFEGNSFAVFSVLQVGEIDKIQLIDHTKKTVKLFIKENGATGESTVSEFLKGLIAEINNQEVQNGDELTSLEVKSDANIEEIWLRDRFKFVLFKLKNGESHVGILDVNTTGVSHLIEMFAQQNSMPYLNANFTTGERRTTLFGEIAFAESNGDHGGNFDITPNGVIYFGENASDRARKFYENELIEKQGMVALDTSWAKVGHVDEFISYARLENHDCGFTLIKADPLLGLQLFDYDEFFAQVDKENIPVSFDFFSEQFRNFQTFTAAKIDDSIERLSREILKVENKFPNSKCREVPVLSIPVLYYQNMGSESENETYVPFFSGSANLVMVNQYAIIADPKYSPFRNYIERAFREISYTPVFVDDGSYFQHSGSIHCATNAIGDMSKEWTFRPVAPYSGPEIKFKDFKDFQVILREQQDALEEERRRQMEIQEIMAKLTASGFF